MRGAVLGLENVDVDVQLGRADHPVSLAAMEWTDMNAYADAKTDVITEIKHRARVTP